MLSVIRWLKEDVIPDMQAAALLKCRIINVRWLNVLYISQIIKNVVLKVVRFHYKSFGLQSSTPTSNESGCLWFINSGTIQVPTDSTAGMLFLVVAYLAAIWLVLCDIMRNRTLNHQQVQRCQYVTIKSNTWWKMKYCTINKNPHTVSMLVLNIGKHKPTKLR